jgi:hypothetical protein
MSELSPAAQAVLDAFCREARPEPHHQREAIAAALRAAADQVVPPALEEEWRDRNQALPLTKMVEIRLKLLAIANELETQ